MNSNFCDKCESLLNIEIIDNKAFFICNKCNIKSEIESNYCLYFINKLKKIDYNNFDKLKYTNILPLIKYKCQKCDNTELQKMRYIYKSVSILYICKKCNSFYIKDD